MCVCVCLVLILVQSYPSRAVSFFDAVVDFYAADAGSPFCSPLISSAVRRPKYSSSLISISPVDCSSEWSSLSCKRNERRKLAHLGSTFFFFFFFILVVVVRFPTFRHWLTHL